MRSPPARLASTVRLGELVHVPQQTHGDCLQRLGAWSHCQAMLLLTAVSTETLSEETGAGLGEPGQGAPRTSSCHLASAHTLQGLTAPSVCRGCCCWRWRVLFCFVFTSLQTPMSYLSLFPGLFTRQRQPALTTFPFTKDFGLCFPRHRCRDILINLTLNLCVRVG